MQNDIDYRRISEFYLLQRRRLKNLKKVEIKANGMILSGYDLQNSLVPFASDLMVSNNEVVIPKDNNMLKACLDLGSYISANPNLISDFAEWFIRWKNEQSQIIEYKVNKNITSDKKLLEAYPDVNESVKTTYEIEAKYANDKKLERLLKNWFEEVGIDIDDIKEYEEQPIIDMRIMLDIFKFCKAEYKQRIFA